LQFRKGKFSHSEILDECQHLIQNQAIANYWATQFLDVLDLMIEERSLSVDAVMGKSLGVHEVSQLFTFFYSLSLCPTLYDQNCPGGFQ
jgi:hypothetical protein